VDTIILTDITTPITRAGVHECGQSLHRFTAFAEIFVGTVVPNIFEGFCVEITQYHVAITAGHHCAIHTYPGLVPADVTGSFEANILIELMTQKYPVYVVFNTQGRHPFNGRRQLFEHKVDLLI
jgi:hypothetical protein